MKQLFKPQNMTKGSVLKIMLSFGFPILLGNLFQQFYNFADLIIVSRNIGVEALEGVGATTSLSELIIVFINGLTNGFSIIIAQFFGAGDEKNVRRSVAATVTISVIFTVIMTALSLFVIRDVLALLHTPDTVMDNAYDYISVLLMGLIFTMAYNMFANILRAIGNSTAPLVFLIISTILNISMDLLFVVVIPLGIRGAALATVLAQFISAFLCFIYIMKKCPEIHLSKKDFSFDKNLLGKMLSTGLSMAMMLAVVSLGSVILQSGINGLGDATIAAHIAARKVISLFMMPIAVIGSACATFTSQNYGAGNMDRVFEGVKKGMLLGILWCTISLLLLFPFTKQFVLLIINKEDAGNLFLIETATKYVRISVPCFYVLILLIVLRNALQGMGRRVVPIIVSATELTGKIVAIRLLVPRLGYLGVCITEPIIWAFDGIFVLIVYIIMRKKTFSRSNSA